MRKLLKFLFVAFLICFVVAPAAFLLFVVAMAFLGVAIGIGSAIVGLVLAVLKVALMVLLPIAALWWVAKKLLAPERSY
ncbi:MAG TPA: hypothetical protein VGG84_13685 [Gemmatimonadaceae bacterium]